MKLYTNNKYLYIYFDDSESDYDIPILRIDKKSREQRWVNESDEAVWKDIENSELIK